jgi:hypothetical protein
MTPQTMPVVPDHWRRTLRPGETPHGVGILEMARRLDRSEADVRRHGDYSKGAGEWAAEWELADLGLQRRDETDAA